MVGTHDNNPIAKWAESMINTHEGYLHAKNLVEDLFAEADNKDDIIVINVSGRGDKDVAAIARYKGVELYE
jgi:tryptophan synthase beta subunit